VSRLASSSISKFERAWSPAYGGGSENFAEAQRATLGRASGAARTRLGSRDIIRRGRL